MKSDAMMRVLRHLRCPVCGAELDLRNDGSSLYCEASEGKKSHCFDLARSGYVNLDTAHAGGGDGKDLVTARTAFLESGAYAPISDAVNVLLSRYAKGGLVIDAGCGEGYYTNRAAHALPSFDLLGFDLSKIAVETAAKAANRTGSRAAFAVGGIFDLPVKDGAASVVMNLFAPCSEAEFSRVLDKDGTVILVGAGENHLFGLKNAVYEKPYRNTPRADLPTQMRLLETKNLHYEIRLESGEMIRNLFSMTPYRFRTSKEDYEKLLALETLLTEVEVDISVYGKV